MKAAIVATLAVILNFGWRLAVLTFIIHAWVSWIGWLGFLGAVLGFTTGWFLSHFVYNAYLYYSDIDND